MMRRLLASTLSALLLSVPALAAPKKGAAAAPKTGDAAAPAAGGGDDFSFDIVEEKVTDTDKQRVEDAKDLLAQERFGEALSAFDAVLNDPKLKKFHEPVQYEMCKAFYKMGAYHASLACFEKILEAGPKHSQYKSSRQWLFFIARKVKDELAALRLIARHAKMEDIPAEYQSELGYSLGRYYFLTALEMGAKGVETEEKSDKPEDNAKPDDNGGALDFSTPDEKKKEEKPPPEKKEEGGFDFSSDNPGGGDVDAQDGGLDFDFGNAKATEKKKAPAKKTKAADKKKEEAKKEEKKEEAKAAAPVEEKKEEPKHTFEGPGTSDEALKLSLQNLGRVKQDFNLYAQAVYIKGLVHFAKGEFDPAVKDFRDVVRMTNPRGGTSKNAKLREMAFFSLARIHYQFEQFRYAIFYYDRIDRDSEQWLEALFESSWAHFRLGEYQKALGNLVTLQSPFFQDEYYPEAAILKAITFYENCRYPEARAFLGEFEQNYGGVGNELNRLIGDAPAGDDKKAKEAAEGGGKADPKAAKPEPKSATDLFNELTELEKKVAEGRDDQNRSFAVTARLLRLALSDKRVKGYREAIDEIDE